MLPARQGQNAALVESRIDLLFCTDAAHLVHRGAHGQQQSARGLGPEALLQSTGRQRKVWGTPAAVASRGAEPGDLLIDHGDSERRIMPQQVVSRPQTGVAGAKNGYIYIR